MYEKSPMYTRTHFQANLILCQDNEKKHRAHFRNNLHIALTIKKPVFTHSLALLEQY
jgi:hypothetical protein